MERLQLIGLSKELYQMLSQKLVNKLLDISYMRSNPLLFLSKKAVEVL